MIVSRSWLLLMTVVWVLLPAAAWAAGPGAFYCSGGHAVGTLYDDGGGVCPTTMKFSNVFSFLICHTEQLSANLMGDMYCGVMRALTPAVTAAVTMAVLFSGIGFMLGFSNVSGKDFLGFLLKVAVIYGFAIEADLIIGIGYNLLISGLRDGTAVAISSLYIANGTMPPNTALDVYALMDGFLAQAFHFATDAVGQAWDKSHNPCQNAIFAVIAVMAIAFPPLAFVGMMIIVRIAMSFLRAIFGYMYSIIGITFLLTLAPFFLSFYLFKQTQALFEKWLGYLVSFSLQLVIVFAFLAFVLSLKFDHITNSLVDVIMPVAQTKEGASFRAPWKYCTLCEFDVVHKDTGAKLDSSSPEFLKSGKLQCRTPKKPIPIDQLFVPPAAAAKGGPPTGGVAPEFSNSLVKFTATGLLSLLVLAYIVDALLGNIPAIAQVLASSLGGAMYAPQLVRGNVSMSTQMGIPGEEVLETLGRGFSDGFNSQSNTASGAIEGFKKAAQRLVVGGPRRADYGYGTNDRSLLQHFRNYLLNPQRGPGE